MTAEQLKTIFEQDYNRNAWLEAVRTIFHVENLHARPQTIEIGENDFNAKAYELGYFETAEGLQVGIYEVNISSDKRLDRNKVGLRNLMRKVYQNDGDAALIVFTQGHTWRFTYASELTVTNKETGLRERKQSDPKRYTYIFGSNQLCRTAAERFSGIKSTTDLFDTRISIHEIEKAFSVDALTKDFYHELSNWYFWALTKVKFPANETSKDELNNATSLIRLITRLIFVWFMKQKGLIPDALFDKAEVNELLNYSDSTGSTYYKAILQNLFFATLNTPIKDGNRSFVSRQTGNQDYYRYQRFFKNKDRFLELTRDIPFLNGGLFDNLDKRIAKGEPDDVFIDCFTNHQDNENLLTMPDFLFFGGAKDIDLSESYDDNRQNHLNIRGIIDILHSYNFTVEENTPLEIQVALDPEMLGKVFENLLASYNPETKTTARKQTGSFYTPREIVNYMVDESLIAYLLQKLQAKNGDIPDEAIPELKLRELVSYSGEDNPFNETDTQLLVNAIGSIKVLDPACGSGAFPMGMLQQLVHILTKLDPDNSRWQDFQINKAEAEIMEALRVHDKEVRHLRLHEIEDAFSLNESDYGRKLFLIENCIYGIDIQPIAVQISKLRFFISLICEQNRQPDNPDNFGIKSLPNLETKFVAANTLIGLEIDPQIEIRTDEILNLEKELVRIRKNHFVERDKARKKNLRDRDKQIRVKILQCIHEEYDRNTEVLHSKIDIEKFSFESFEKSLQAEKLAGPRKKLEERMVQIKKEIVRINEKITKNQFFEQNLMLRAAWDPYNTNESSGFYDSEWMYGIENGFDIVIGNPPYIQLSKVESVSPEYREYLKKRYNTSAGRLNTFIFFIHHALDNLSGNGLLTFIIPNTILTQEYYSYTREYILKNFYLKEIVNYVNMPFENAVVENVTIIIQTKKTNFCETKITSDDLVSVKLIALKKVAYFLKQDNFSFSFKSDTTIEGIYKQDKISFVGEICTVNQAIALKGDKSISLRNHNSDNIYYKLLDGRNIKKYEINWSGVYIDYSVDRIHSCKRTDIFESKEKLFFRRVSENLVFAYDDQQYFALNTLVVINIKKGIDFNIRFLLAILNSSLMNYIYKSRYKSTKKVFSEIQANTVEKLPLKNVMGPIQIQLISLVDKILNAKKLNPNVDTSEFERQIDIVVYKLYELEYDQVFVIDPEFWMGREEYEGFEA